MSKYFPRQLLFRIRNEIPVDRVIAQHVGWPSKRREGQFCFLCPRCEEFVTATNPKTNLARCFRCEVNFNPIDIVMECANRDFVEAVHFLTTLLPSASDQS